MKRLIFTLFCLMVCFGFLRAQNTDSLRTVEVEEIVVKAARSLRDIGVQKSIMNESVLRNNLSATMAEVLAQNSTIFIKSSGRATLSTASLRGTAPSHTAVSWNGIELGSPMLGMVDFSMIPSYFVDGGEVYHGATSVNVAGGGLGGAVVLTTDQGVSEGFGFQYVQNVASYSTHDEYLRLNYGAKRWGASTRVLSSASENDFPYVNYDKVGHPLERNKNCGYNDFHLLQEFFARGSRGGRWSLKAWYTDSSRGIPRLGVDYRNDELTKAWQDERSLRSVAEWARSFGGLRLVLKGGYNHDKLHYVYQFSRGAGDVGIGVDSESVTSHAFASTSAEWSIGNGLMLAANLKGGMYGVESEDIAPLVPTGYRAERAEVASFLSARWKPTDWLGLAASVREEWRDGAFTPLIPAAFVDVTLVPEIGLIVSGSWTRNYHSPTLNDLYFVPGGNPNLRPEQGESFDLGVEASVERKRWSAGGKVTIYHSNITDWILWTPTIKGFWSPENLSAVRSEGVESRANATYSPTEDLSISLKAVFALTSSTNVTLGSATYGNQLPYIPRYSASASLGIRWRRWELDYKWRYYSDRYTTHSNDTYRGAVVPAYHLSDASLSRSWESGEVVFKARFEVCNLLNATYQSMLSRPMPPRNYALTVECRFGR